MKLETLTLEKKEGVATITLNRPDALNAINSTMMQELIQTFKELKTDDEVKVVVLTGAGRAFCAGADFKEIGRRTLIDAHEGMRNVHELIFGIRSLPKPVIAAVNGSAIGLGCGLTTACDIRIASENARFAERFVKMGLMPGDGNTYLLPLLVGLGKASELLFTGDFIDAREAERVGLVNKVVPPDRLKAEVDELAGRLAKGASKAIATAKEAINRHVLPGLRSDMDFSAYAQPLLTQTEDHAEAVQAFREKREPKFKGR